MSNIRNSNLLYRPAISVWTARKLDREETGKVNEAAGAVASAARVNKSLLPDSPQLVAVQKYQGVFRNWVYTSTLPWDDSGARIGQVRRHMDFMAEAGDKMREFDTLVDAFMDSYAAEIENAKFTLNTMFKAEDYPGVDEVRAKFRISLDVMPLPDAGDFRIIDGITPEEADKLCAVATDAVEQRLKAAMAEAYQRLFKVVSTMSSTLTLFDKKEIKKFNDTLTGNIAELVQVMPALNITDDPLLRSLANEARQLLDYTLLDLRKDTTSRNAAIADAADLAERINLSMPDNLHRVQSAPKANASLFADMLETT